MSSPFQDMFPYLRQLQGQFGSLFGQGGTGNTQWPGASLGQNGNEQNGGWPFSASSMNPADWMRGVGGFGGAQSAGLPADVYETSSHVVVIIEVPGLSSASDIALSVNPETLIIKGRTVRRYESSGKHVLKVTERRVGEFERQISLPTRVKRTGAQARYQNGLLEIQLIRDGEPNRQSGTTVPVDFR